MGSCDRGPGQLRLNSAALSNVHYCWLQQGIGSGSILELLKIYWAFTLEPCANTGKGGSEAGIQAKAASGPWGTLASQLLSKLLLFLLV